METTKKHKRSKEIREKISKATKEAMAKPEIYKRHLQTHQNDEYRKMMSNYAYKENGLIKNGKEYSKMRIGKTYEELYGKERAKEIKNSLKEAKLRNPTKYWLGKKRPEVGILFSKINKGKHTSLNTEFKVGEYRRLNTKATKIEMKIRDQLKSKGYEFETNKLILGRPDIYIPSLNLCIFADGCYHHACNHCNLVKGNKPMDNYAKSRFNRDFKIKNELELEGYNVIKLWGHDINKKDFDIQFFIDKHHNIKK